MPKLTIELPQTVYDWAVEKAERDFRSTEEWCSILIRKEHRDRAEINAKQNAYLKRKKGKRERQNHVSEKRMGGDHPGWHRKD